MRSYFNSLFRYENGKLFWRIRKSDNTILARPIDCLDKHGYNVVGIDYKQWKVHRVIWIMHYGDIPNGKVLDHINRSRNDNRIENLRLLTARENIMNAGLHSNNKSGYVGVSWDKKRKSWRATAVINYKQYDIGRFDTPAIADKARREFLANEI